MIQKNLGVAVIIYHWFMIPQSSTVYVVKSPVLGLQGAPEDSELAPSVQFSLTKPIGIQQLGVYCPNINTVLKTKSQRKEVLAGLVELFNPFRTLNTHMHSKASLMVNKHHSEPSLVFFAWTSESFCITSLGNKTKHANQSEQILKILPSDPKSFKDFQAC